MDKAEQALKALEHLAEFQVGDLVTVKNYPLKVDDADTANGVVLARRSSSTEYKVAIEHLGLNLWYPKAWLTLRYEHHGQR